MDGQRIEHFVAENDALDRLGSDLVALRAIDQHASTTGFLESRDDRVDPARLHLDRLVPKDPGEVRAGGLQAVEDGGSQGPRASAVLTQDERIGTTEPLPDFIHTTRQGRAEDRVSLGRGQEVAVASRPRGVAPVVASLGVVQGEVHEASERDRAAGADLGMDPGDKACILADRVEVRRRLAT